MVSSRSRSILFFVLVISFTAIRFINPIQSLSNIENNVLLIIFLSIIGWILRIGPNSIIGLVALTSFWAIGLDTHVIFSGFATESLFFFFGVLLLSQIITETELHLVVANKILGSVSDANVLSVVLPPILLLMALPVPSATARAGALKPIVENFVVQRSALSKRVMIALGPINRICGRAYLSGGLATILAVTILNQSGYSITWVDWLVYMWPPIGLLVIITTICITIYYKFQSYRLSTDAGKQNDVNLNSDVDINFSQEQILVIVIIVCIIFMWILSSFISMPEFVPLITLLSLLFLSPSNICDKETVSNMNLDILIFFGVTLSYPTIIQETNISSYIINNIFNNISTTFDSFLIFIILLMGVLSVFRIFLIGPAYVAVIIPLVIELSRTFGYDPLISSFGAIFAGCVVFFPVQAPSTLLAFEGPYLNQWDTIFTGIIIFITMISTFLFCFLVYWPILR